MELSSVFTRGIAIAGDKSKISDDVYDKLLSTVFRVAISQEADDSASLNDRSDEVNEAAAGLLALVLEGAKNNADDSVLRLQLEECNVSSDRATKFIEFYKREKEEVRCALGRVGGGRPPHLTHVDWSLDYRVKNGYLNQLCEPFFQVDLGSNRSDSVSFACNLAQMQDLVHTLRDVVKCVQAKAQGEH